jgi:hypothetical protein
MSGPRHTVHVRVNDAATAQPTPVRLRITDKAGQYYAPHGRLVEFATGRNRDVGGNLLVGSKAFAYIDGSCEIGLPSGDLLVEISKGPEFRPIQTTTMLGVGKMALRFNLERWIDSREEGWYSGDTRAHFLTPHAALLEAAAEDLAVVNVLARECDVEDRSGQFRLTIPNILAFSGQRPALEWPGHLVVVNTYNTHPVLGELGLLNCHRAVYPLSFGGRHGRDNWSLAAWCDQCHRKGGLVVWPPTRPRGTALSMGEALADLILGKIDALELDSFEESPRDVLPEWYQLLNCGIRVPIVASSGKESNTVALGGMRTYARLQPGEPFTYQGWIESIRAGRTFVTNGPLLRLAVNGHDPGASIDMVEIGQVVQVHAGAGSVVPFDRLDILVNGAIVASAAASGDPRRATLDVDVPFSNSGWLAAHATGRSGFAHTSPVYVSVGGKPIKPETASLSALTRHLDDMLEWSKSEARVDKESQREQLIGIFQAARAALLERK